MIDVVNRDLNRYLKECDRLDAEADHFADIMVALFEQGYYLDIFGDEWITVDEVDTETILKTLLEDPEQARYDYRDAVETLANKIFDEEMAGNYE